MTGVNRHPLMKSEVVRLARMMFSSSASSGCRSERVRVALDGSVCAGGVREREYSVEDFPPMVVFPVHKGIQVKLFFKIFRSLHQSNINKYDFCR